MTKQSKTCIIIAVRKKKLEKYPSGYKGTHSKCVRAGNRRVGSNPTFSVTRKKCWGKWLQYSSRFSFLERMHKFCTAKHFNWRGERNDNRNERKLLFRWGLFQYIGYRILGFLVTVLTFGICLPWAYTMIYKWRIKHTVINGKRLYFDGTALQLFGNWIKWWFLTVITFGIYGFWVFIKLEQWKTKHTHFRDSCKGSNVPFIKKNRSGI